MSACYGIYASSFYGWKGLYLIVIILGSGSLMAVRLENQSNVVCSYVSDMWFDVKSFGDASLNVG